MSEICLISHPDRTIRSFHVDSQLARWGEDSPRIVFSAQDIHAQSLFSEIPAHVLHLDTADDVKKALPVLEKIVGKDFPSGVIISTPVSVRSLKKMQAWVESLGGTSVIGAKKDAGKLVETMLSSVAIPRESKRFLSEYAGDDPSLIVSVIQGLQKLPLESQKKVTPQKIVPRLPLPPGAVPPWNVEKELFDGTAKSLVGTYRKVVRHTHPLVVLSFVKSSVLGVYYAQNGAKGEDLGALTGKRGYPLTLMSRRAKKYSSSDVERAVEIIVQLDKNVKGGSHVDPVTLTEIALVEIFSLLKK